MGIFNSSDRARARLDKYDAQLEEVKRLRREFAACASTLRAVRLDSKADRLEEKAYRYKSGGQWTADVERIGRSIDEFHAEGRDIWRKLHDPGR